MNGLFSSYSGSRKNGTRITEKPIGRGAPGRGSLRTCSIALFRYFFPMYPLGHRVSEMSSTGITRSGGGPTADAENSEMEGHAMVLCRDRDNLRVYISYHAETTGVQSSHLFLVPSLWSGQRATYAIRSTGTGIRCECQVSRQETIKS